MAALRSRCGYYIFVLWFLLSSSTFYLSFFPRLIVNAPRRNGTDLFCTSQTDLLFVTVTFLYINAITVKKTLQFKTVCKDDSGYITQLKQQKYKEDIT